MERNQSVFRALAILDLLSAEGKDMGVREIARSMGISSSIAQRLISTLAEAGYVEQSPDQKYSIGYKAFRTGSAFLEKSDLAEASLKEMRFLSEEHMLNTYTGVRRGNEAIYLSAMQSRGPITIASAPGSKAHLHSTAMGKALLAELDDSELDQILGKEPYRKLTELTLTRRSALFADIVLTRERGYAICNGENLVGVFAAAAVIRDVSDTAIASLSIARHVSQVGQGDAERLGAIVRQSAGRITRSLGGRVSPALSEPLQTVR